MKKQKSLKNEILLSSTNNMSAYDIVETIGLIQGSITISNNLFQNILNCFLSIFGCELKNNTKILDKSKRIALKRMISQARQLEANAILSIRFSIKNIWPGIIQSFVYGTAVKIKQKK